VSDNKIFVAEYLRDTVGEYNATTGATVNSAFISSGLNEPVGIVVSTPSSVTGSATWGRSPATGDWNTAGNWTPATVPNGSTDTATFGKSNTTSVSISANTEVNGIVFNSGANAFTITASPTFTLTISGVGITNNSGVTQNLVTAVDGSGNFGTVSFSNSATAGSMTVITNKASTLGFQFPGGGGFGGTTVFNNTSTAGSATINNNGGAVFGTGPGTTIFNDSSTAGNATINNSGASADQAGAGLINFDNTSSAGSATITNNGSAFTYIFAAAGTIFLDSSTAGAATLIANGGSAGGNGGRINFDANSDGGTARVEVFGNGKLDISGHNAPGVTIGSIEGDGNAFLGANNLTVGSNNLSTVFSGVIQDGGFFGGTGGALTKIGTGTLTLSGVNTYTGPTTIDAGVLNVTGSITSAVTVNGGGTLGTAHSLAVTSGGTLSGGGTTGSVTVNRGGTVAPTGQHREAPPPIPGLSATGNAVAAASFGALHVNGDYVQNAGGTLALGVAGATPGSFDQLIVTGRITLETGAILELDFLNGFAPTKGEVFDFLSSGISSITGTFTTVNLEGLAPGFKFDLAPGSNGTFDLTALNNGVSVSGTVPDASSTWTLLLLSLTSVFGLKFLLRHEPRIRLRVP
jgi:autotransporter-associated beta strand protein